MGLTESIQKAIGEMGRQVMGRIANLARITGVEQVKSDGARVTARAAVNFLETHENVQVLEASGFTSTPPAGSQGLLLCLGGDGAHAVLLQVGNPAYRLTDLAPGESAIHMAEATGLGARIICRTDGTIEVNPGPLAKVSIVPNGAVQPPLPVARQTDPVALSTENVAALNVIVGAWNALATGGGGPLIVPPGSALVFDGTGTVTSGGSGAEST